MANPASVGVAGAVGAGLVKVTNGSDITVTLDPDRVYTFHSTGLDDSGSASTKVVRIGFASGTSADTVEGANKCILPSSWQYPVGPNVTTVYLQTTASGTQMVNIIPGPNFNFRR